VKLAVCLGLALKLRSRGALPPFSRIYDVAPKQRNNFAFTFFIFRNQFQLYRVSIVVTSVVKFVGQKKSRTCTEFGHLITHFGFKVLV
jgi:hypothetical protein